MSDSECAKTENYQRSEVSALSDEFSASACADGAREVGRTALRELDFDKLPNDAFVDKYQVCKLLSCSVATVWRWCKDGRLPQPVRFGARLTRWRVGDLRSVLRKGR